MIYRSQIDQLEAHLAVGNETGRNHSSTSHLFFLALAELPLALEKLHQTYIALAAGVQIIITALHKVKQKYLNYRFECFFLRLFLNIIFRRQIRGDTSDPFLNKNKPKGLNRV